MRTTDKPVAYATDHVAPDADVPGRARFPRLGTGGAVAKAYPGGSRASPAAGSYSARLGRASGTWACSWRTVRLKTRRNSTKNIGT
jgi:hypothetical protein